MLAAQAGHAINLGGVEVPKDKMVVFLMIGHSNMAGQQIQASDGVTHPRAWNYQWSSTKTWVPAKETPGARTNGLGTRGAGGPSMPLLKQLVAAYPDHHFGIVNNASLSSTLKGTNTGNNTSHLPASENRYAKGATLYNEIITAAKEIQAQVTLGGIVCMLGAVEATRTPESVCRAFSADLAEVATDMRTDLGLPNLPFYKGEYEAGATGQFALSRPMPTIIDAEIKLMPTKLAYSASISSVGIEMLDDHHYTAVKGQGEFAKRIITTMQTKGWFPGSTSSILVMPKSEPRNAGMQNAMPRLIVGPNARQSGLVDAQEGQRATLRFDAAGRQLTLLPGLNSSR
jgi:Carbohydrate esterase, sialic acid-specific acetylesterase